MSRHRSASSRRGRYLLSALGVLVVAGAAVVAVALGSGGADGHRAGSASSASPSRSTSPAASSSPRRAPSTVPPPTAAVTDVAGTALPSKGVITLAQLRAAAKGTRVTVRTLTYDRLTRAYIVVAPLKQAGPLPMIVGLQGVHSPTTQEVERDEFVPYVAAGKVVLVYPVPYLESWNAVDCCSEAQQAKVDDIGFVPAAVRDAWAQLQVQREHTYLVGFSNGGKLGFELLCRGEPMFAAFASVAAVPSTSCGTRTTGHPTPFLMIAGSLDPDLPFRHHGKPALQEIARTTGIWRARNGCTATATDTTTIDTATETTYGTCSSKAPVAQIVYDGLKHKWPQTSLVGADAAAGARIWDFFTTA